MAEILEFMNNYGIILTGIIALLVEWIVKPFKKSLKKIVIEANKPINDEQIRLRDDFQKLTDKVNRNNISTIRSRIVAFDSLVRTEEKIQQHHYKVIFADIDKWVEYHELYPELNGMIDVAIENIKESYKNAKF